jgi:HAD superfamily hydrolase (TIGR01450 family)
MSGLMQALNDAGLNVTTGEEMPTHPVVAVAAGMDREITYGRLKVAVRLILNGAVFIATNTDPTFVTPEGLNPGTGLIVGALQGATHVEPLVMGKPGEAIYHAAMRHLGADPATTAMLGDRLDTDILGAQRVGVGSIAVLTGVTSAAELRTSNIQPDCVFDSIGELAEALSGA